MLAPMQTTASRVSFSSETFPASHFGKGRTPPMLSASRIPDTVTDRPESGDDDDDDDDGMDFFQMLASDPSALSPNPMVTPMTRARSTTNPFDRIQGQPDVTPYTPDPPSATSPEVGHRSSVIGLLSKTSFANLLGGKSVTVKSVQTGVNSRVSSQGRSRIQGSSSGGMGQAPTAVFLDFVNMNGRKPLTELTARESWWPVAFGEWSQCQ